jgi:hypothetical protein
MEMDDGPSGIALSSGSSDVDMADVASVASSGGQGRDAPSVFSVDDEARSALVLTPGGRRSLSADFNDLGSSSFRVASAGSPSRLASPDGVSGLQDWLRDAVSDRSSSVESFHTAVGPRSLGSPSSSGRRPLGSTAPLGHSRRVSGLAPAGHVRYPSGSSTHSAGSPRGGPSGSSRPAPSSPLGRTAVEAIIAYNAAQPNNPPEIYRPHRIPVPLPSSRPRALLSRDQWAEMLTRRGPDNVIIEYDD